MEYTWRWYGPNDPVTLSDIRQAGATSVVTALHHIPNGDIWTAEEIEKRKEMISAAGLGWHIVESLPVHEDIKLRQGDFESHIENYKVSLRNLASQGIDTICYNFMPVLDWTRTELDYELPDGSKALRFNHDAFAAFDLFVLKRPDAGKSFTSDEIASAKSYFEAMTEEEIETLTRTIIAGLPGAEEGYTLAQFQAQLDKYADIDEADLSENLHLFLKEIMPICEDENIVMAIHPDDPPRPMFGLPRIMSHVDHMNHLVKAVPSPANGFTMCTGSYGVRLDNDLVNMIKAHADRIFFTHLRSTKSDGKDFYEAAHLEGDVNMYGVVEAILTEEKSRQDKATHQTIPMRPDHGHQILDDLKKTTNPGYSAIGRLKGMAEIRGLEMGIRHQMK